MPNSPSRRELLGAAVVGLTALAVPLASAAQNGQDSGMEAIDKELAKPLSPEAKKLLKEAIKGIETLSKERLKTKLPENSEPCFSYCPSAREVRTK